MRVTNLANGAADAIAALQSQVTQLNNNFQYKELTNEFDLNNALGKYRTDSSVIIASLKNKPSEIRNSGETTLDWYPASERNTYGIQIMRWTYGNTHIIFARNKIENTWAEWVQYVTKSDLQSDWIPLKPYLVNSWEDNGASLYRKIGNCYLVKLSVRYGNYEADLDICRNLPFSGTGVCTNCFYNSSEVGNAIQVSGNRLFIARTPIAKMDTIFANFIVGPDV